MRRYVCPRCEAGRNAPARMRRDDARRYCLGCTGATGCLVEVAAPAAETAKRKRAEARTTAKVVQRTRAEIAADAAAARVAQLAAARTRSREDAAEWLRAWVPRVLALSCWNQLADQHGLGSEDDDRSHWAGGRYGYVLGDHRPKGGVAIVIRQGGPARAYASGRAWPWRQRLVVTTGWDAADDLSTLVHEVAHLVAPCREHHGPRFRTIEAAAIAELTGVLIPTTTAVFGPYRGVRRENMRAWLGAPGPAEVAAGEAARAKLRADHAAAIKAHEDLLARQRAERGGSS